MEHVHRSGAGALGRPPLIAHVIHHLVIGGLENGLVNLINRMPPDRYRHAIVCMVDYSDFSRRIRRDDVQIFAMHKKAGKGLGIYGRLYRLFRQLDPDVVHSRNLTALDSLLPATLAGVRVKIHGEHGRDVFDIDGTNARYRLLRRLHRPMVSHYTAVSRDLEDYLREGVGVPPERITQIYNGVDTSIFHPPANGRDTAATPWGPGRFVVGTVGRMQPVKDQMTLVRAMIALWRGNDEARRQVRLVLIGDGPLRGDLERAVSEAGVADLVWFAGARTDVPDMMRALDLFVLPSLAEGISNTILEAMASGLPVLATAVGGNPELVEDGVAGTLVPAGDPQRMAAALRAYVENPDLRRSQGSAALATVERRFQMDVMVSSYMKVYDNLLAAAQTARAYRRSA